MMNRVATAVVGILAVVTSSVAEAQSLKGSSAAMRRQNSVAQQLEYSFLQTGAEVRDFVEKGLLIPARGNSNYKLAGVSFPYTRPAVKLFVDRLGEQYRSACGEKMVVTSLTRPVNEQPWNASELSVHPAGMAVDIRLSRRSACRRWVEGTFKDLEKKGVVDATREYRPAHYHVAVFPNAYTRYVTSLDADAAKKLAANSNGVRIASGTGASYASVTSAGAKPAARTKPAPAVMPAPATRPAPVAALQVTKPAVVAAVQAKPSGSSYKVKSGDSLWTIARSFGLTVADLKQANGLNRSTLQPGQQLTIPGTNRLAASNASIE